MSENRTIGSGVVLDFQWVLDAGGDEDSYWTGLTVTGPGDYRCSGGMAGPPLWGDDLINTYSARNEKGPLGIAVRARVDVTRVLIRSRQGDETDPMACEPGVIDGCVSTSASLGLIHRRRGSVSTRFVPSMAMGTRWIPATCHSGTAWVAPDSRGTRSVSPTRLLSSRLADLLLERRIE